MKNKIPVTLELLVGITDDYNGRDYINNNPTTPFLLASFYSNQSGISNFFMQSLDTLYKDNDFVQETSGNSNIYTKNHATLFNKYYDFSKISKIGILKQNMFDNDTKKCSFILGAFIRNGTINNNNQVVLTFANSLSHFQAVHDFSKILDWKIINIKKSEKDSFPQEQQITIVVSDQYMNLFNIVKTRSKNL